MVRLFYGRFRRPIQRFVPLFAFYLTISLPHRFQYRRSPIGLKPCEFRLEDRVKQRRTRLWKHNYYIDIYILMQRLRYWFRLVSRRLVSPRLLIGFETHKTAPFKSECIQNCCPSCAQEEISNMLE